MALKPTKHICWHSDQAALGYLLFNYSGDSLATFLELFDEAKKTFPDLTPEDVTCGKVLESDCIKKFTLMTFQVEGPKRKFKGWAESHSIDFGY